MSQFNPPFRSAIFYAVQNEDYLTELTVLRRIFTGTPLRVLLVASSGENALSLLSQDFVAEVCAVDLNPAQLHLCELRMRGVDRLSRDEQLALFGADPTTVGPPGAAQRMALYEHLRPVLSAPARAFWDERREQEIAFGLQHVGRNEVCMHDLQDALGAADFAPLQRPVRDEELPAWQAVYSELMTPAYIRDIFGLPSEALAAKIAGIAAHLGESHFRSLQEAGADRNPFVTTVFANAYARAAGEHGYPLYLQHTGQAALRRLGIPARLDLIQGNVLEQMPLLAATQPFDLISLSNIADWMTEAQFVAAIDLALRCLKRGGAVLARTAAPSSMIVNVIRRQMAFDPQFNEQLSTNRARALVSYTGCWLP